MAPLPKRRHSTQRQGKRRAAIKIKLPLLVVCPKCKNLKISHQACPKCDTYKLPVSHENHAGPATSKKR